MCTMLCTTTDAELSRCEFSPAENTYATAPMVAVMPAPQPLDEEVLYTSFEEAISDRVVALQGRLSRLSDAHIRRETDPMVSSARPSRLGRLFGGWRRGVVFACFALICVLLGFDVMGLLVLYLH